MSERGQLYTAGFWKVKSGKEAEFIEAWQAFADWTSENQTGAGEGALLQNEENPQRFLSFGPWDSAESIAHWRSRPQFQDFIAKARALCEEMQPQTMKLVGYSSPQDT